MHTHKQCSILGYIPIFKITNLHTVKSFGGVFQMHVTELQNSPDSYQDVFIIMTADS